MKKLIAAILLSVFLGALYIRYEAIQLGKKSYVLGCADASVKLQLLGDLAESIVIEKFCKAREEALDNYLGVF